MGFFNFFSRSNNDLHTLKKLKPQGFRNLSRNKASYTYDSEYQRRRYLVQLPGEDPYITYDARILAQLRKTYGTKFPRVAFPVFEDECGYYIVRFQYSRRYKTLRALLIAWNSAR